MKSQNSLILLLVGNIVCAQDEPIQRRVLDDRAVITVSVATNRVTTISFPSTITAIDGAGVTVDLKLGGDFLLAHTKGSCFLSLRAIARKASANLNIRWNKRTYVFELMESSNPVLALNLEDAEAETKAQVLPFVSPTRLLALLDKAKSYRLLKQQHPESVAHVEAKILTEKPEITDFVDFEIRTVEIFRFNAEDSLVFHVLLRNKSDRDIRYLTDSFAVRVGDRLYHQSISDASGIVPVNSETTAYFVITGTPDGGRNELSLKNRFSVLVTRSNEPSPSQPEPELFPLSPPEGKP